MEVDQQRELVTLSPREAHFINLYCALDDSESESDEVCSVIEEGFKGWAASVLPPEVVNRPPATLDEDGVTEKNEEMIRLAKERFPDSTFSVSMGRRQLATVERNLSYALSYLNSQVDSIGTFFDNFSAAQKIAGPIEGVELPLTDEERQFRIARVRERLLDDLSIIGGMIDKIRR